MNWSKFSEGADRLHSASSGGGNGERRGVPQGGHQRGDILRLAEEVCRSDAVKMDRLKQLEEENGKLKKIVADLSLDKAMSQDALSRKL